MGGPDRRGSPRLEPQHWGDCCKGCREFEDNLGYRENLSRKKEIEREMGKEKGEERRNGGKIDEGREGRRQGGREGDILCFFFIT